MANEKAIQADKAHLLKERVLKLKVDIGLNTLELGHILKRIRDEKHYASLGYENFNTFLGDPEVSVGRTTAYDLIEIWEVFVDKLKRDHKELASIDYSKLTKIVPVVERDPDEWISRAATLSRSDLIVEVREELGIVKEEKETKPTAFLDVPLGSSKKYVEFVKTCQCILCGKTPVDPHHFPVTRGAGRDEVDGWVIPLCRECHDEAQVGGKDWMWTYRNQWGRYLFGVIFSLMQKTVPEKDRVISVEPIGTDVQAEVFEAEVVTEVKALPPASEEDVPLPFEDPVSDQSDEPAEPGKFGRCHECHSTWPESDLEGGLCPTCR